MCSSDLYLSEEIKKTGKKFGEVREEKKRIEKHKESAVEIMENYNNSASEKAKEAKKSGEKADELKDVIKAKEANLKLLEKELTSAIAAKETADGLYGKADKDHKEKLTEIGRAHV